jgi:AraC-like DNA-binding protein
MNRAKELLRTSSDISIKELAQELGSTKQHEFTRAFHRFFGMSPSRLKRERAVSQVTKWLPVRQQYFSTSTKDKLRAVE